MKKALLVVALFSITILSIAGLMRAASCSVEAFFVSPDVDKVIERKVIEAIDSAKDRILIAMHLFTDDDLGEAVVSAYKRGVDVHILLDEGQESGTQGKEWPKLVAAGIPVMVEHVIGLMHHQFAVIDDLLTVTGSYNWTKNADETNFENVVFISCEEIALAYRTEFFRIWEELSGVVPSHPMGQELFVELVSLTSPVRAGEDANLAVKTLPGAECSIRVRYQSGWSTAAGLYSKQADEEGNVSWTWVVETHTAPGTWLIYIITTLDSETAKLEIPLTVSE